MGNAQVVGQQKFKDDVDQLFEGAIPKATIDD